VVRQSVRRRYNVDAIKSHLLDDELAFAKYCQKEWPSESVDRVVGSIVRNRRLSLDVMSVVDRGETARPDVP